jgi:hypothetical protein
MGDANPSAEAALSVRVELSHARAAWLARFWIPAQLRRERGAVNISVVDGSSVEVVALQPIPEEEDADAKWCEKWKKKVDTGLNKVIQQDLGPMNAPELLQAIHDTVNTNTGNTGIADLTTIEQKLSVLVYFDCTDGPGKDHVLLLGTKKKLDNKCAGLRSILSHYHWRLSGKDVAFDAMVS